MEPRTTASGQVHRALGPLMIDVPGLALEPDDRELLGHPAVGGVVLFARNYESPAQLTRLVSEIHAVREPALVVAVDQEGGRVQRFLAGCTALPSARSVGAVYARDPVQGRTLAAAVGTVLGAELGEMGIDVDFAPVVDLAGGNERVIGSRAFHPDPAAVAALAASQLRSMREWGVEGVAKHFPGHGSADGDTHLEAVYDSRGLETLRRCDLSVYRALLAEGLGAVMTAHVTYPEVAPEPATFSSRWLKDVLRRELGFSGLVLSDDLGMEAARTGGSLGEPALAALSAGCDAVLLCNDRPRVEAFLGATASRLPPSGLERLGRTEARRPSTREGRVAQARACVARHAEDRSGGV